MLGMRPMDSQVALEQQLQDHHAEPVVLMIVFTVDADDVDAFNRLRNFATKPSSDQGLRRP